MALSTWIVTSMIKRVVLPVVAIAALILCVYWNNGAPFVPSKLSSSQGCGFVWNNSKVGLEFYEGVQTKAKKLSSPQPVSSMYPDPTIRLNPYKFLLPILRNGPNNQLSGLREAAFVSIKLNRTLVIPRFFKHFSDSSATSRNRDYIYPGHRIEIEDLCKFISCISIEQFQRACGYKIDGAFHLLNYIKQDINYWETYTAMRMARILTHDEFDAKLIPSRPISNGERHRIFQENEIASLFGSEKPCLLYPKPLYNLKLSPMSVEKNTYDITLLKRQEDLKSFSASRIFLSVCDASGPPHYIKNIVKEIIKRLLYNKPFIGVHWRYNKDDFMNRCKGKGGDELKLQMCANAMLIKPKDIAKAIANKVGSAEKKYSSSFSVVYIASPPTESNFIAEVARNLLENHGWETYTSTEVVRYLMDNYGGCNILQKHFQDILSTIEMQICTLSTIFLGSIRSSWSDNVLLSRKARRPEASMPEMDDDIYSMSLSAMDEL